MSFISNFKEKLFFFKYELVKPGSRRCFEQQAEGIVEKVKIFEYGEFENGEDDGQRGFLVFCAEKAKECLGEQEECEPPVENRVEGVTCRQQEPSSAFLWNA